MAEKGHMENLRKAWDYLQKHKDVPYGERGRELHKACRKYLLGDEA